MDEAQMHQLVEEHWARAAGSARDPVEQRRIFASSLLRASSGYCEEVGWNMEAASKGELAAYDAGCNGMMAALERILDGEDDGAGVSNEPWEALRRRVIDLVRRPAGKPQVKASRPARDVASLAESIRTTAECAMHHLGPGGAHVSRFISTIVEDARRLRLAAAAAPVPTQAEHAMFDAYGAKRIRYVRVIRGGRSCVVRPGDVASLTAGAQDDSYQLRDVFLSPEEFDKLPDVGGF